MTEATKEIPAYSLRTGSDLDTRIAVYRFGAVLIEVGGTVIVKPAEEWHKLALALSNVTAERDAAKAKTEEWWRYSLPLQEKCDKLEDERDDALRYAVNLKAAAQAVVDLDDGDSPDLWHFKEEFEALRDAIAAAPTAKNEIGQFDKGPWKVGTNNGLPSVYSDDFTHDVVLAISGNFESKAQHQAYAEALAARLNCDSQYSSEVRQSPVVAAVLDEVRRATEKFPTWPTDPLHAVAVLGEEFGELTKAALQLTYEPHKTTADEVRTEAIQTAAMALRFAMSLGVYLYQPGAQHAQQTACPAQSPKNYLSVCSGIEAATVAWHPLGWRAIAFSEIEKFPCALLAHHYPTSRILGT
jgi:hypothetical protein